MQDWIVSILGATAAVCSTFALLPQSLRVWRTREVEQLSFGTLCMMLAGSVLWCLYGIFRIDIIIIAANTIAFIFISYLWTIKALHLRKRHENNPLANDSLL